MSDNTDRTRINLTITKVQMEALDSLVVKGIYMEQTAAIRDALRILFRLHGIEPFHTDFDMKSEERLP